MGIRFRKSLNLGCGFRVNLSKSGINYSWGIPGYRITKTSTGRLRSTASIRGTGISFVDEINLKDKKKNSVNDTSIEENFEEIKNAENINNLQDLEFVEIKNKIENLLKYNKLSTIIIIISILFFNFFLMKFILIVGIILKVFLHCKAKINIEYNFEDDTFETFNKRNSSWLLLNKSNMKWQILSQTFNKNLKVNAGAERIIKREKLLINSKMPWFLKSNIIPVVLKIKNEKVLLLPDKVLILRKNKIGVMKYDNLDINIDYINFIEDGVVPKDAKIVDYTWKFLNKNGSPDKRYKNNKKLPVCKYGKIAITSPEGINLEFQISNIDTLTEFKNNLL